MSGARAGVSDSVTLRPALPPDDMDAVRTLLMSYGRSFDFHICFEGFERELSSLPGEYSPPAGRLILAEIDGRAVGVVAMRSLAHDGAAELKRLYVDPAARGRGLGRRLTEAVVAEARAQGYRKLRLETLSVMASANRIYDELGFVVTAPFAGAATEIVSKELAL
jgi:ribosomal protein S18 acetylase RimI-like enzyme